MSATQAVETTGKKHNGKSQRKLINALVEPFLQFKLLVCMLGMTALVAVLLGLFLYFAFGGLIESITYSQDTTSYYQQEINTQLVHLFRYCGALIILYVLLLAAVCVTYTHRLVGPFTPFSRHLDEIAAGNFSHRISLRKTDVTILKEYAEKMNSFTAQLEKDELNKNAKGAKS